MQLHDLAVPGLVSARVRRRHPVAPRADADGLLISMIMGTFSVPLISSWRVVSAIVVAPREFPEAPFGEKMNFNNVITLILFAFSCMFGPVWDPFGTISKSFKVFGEGMGRPHNFSKQITP